MGAAEGNKNALKGEHGRRLIGISGPDLDLLYEYLAQQGNTNPTYKELKEAALSAIRQVYSSEQQSEEK